MSQILPFDWPSLLAKQPLLPVWANVDVAAAPQLALTLLEAGYKVLGAPPASPSAGGQNISDRKSVV